MKTSRFVKTGMNPFTREPFEFFDVGQLIPEPAPSIAFDLEPSRGTAARSHFLGSASLAPGTEWPHGPNGPLTFLLTLDFAELGAVHARSEGLPTNGVLNVFYDTAGADWSLSPAGPKHWRLLYESGEVVNSPSPGSSKPAVPFRMQPRVQDPRDGHPRHQLVGDPRWIQVDQRPWLHFVSGQYQTDADAIAALDRAGLPRDALATSDRQALLFAARAFDAAAVDPAMFKPGVADWKLLLQIDSDESLSFCWGDVGTLYVLIRTASLHARRFEDAWICMQCY